MKSSRRTFLKCAAAIPVAATIGIASVAEAATPAVVAALPVYPFQWWFSYDGGELFTENFDTKEVALAFLQHEGEGMIAECQQQDFDLRLDAYEILETLSNNNEELIGDGEFIEPNKEQMDDLEKSVNAAIDAWAIRNKISLTAWTFGEVRNQVEIPKAKKTKAAVAA